MNFYEFKETYPDIPDNDDPNEWSDVELTFNLYHRTLMLAKMMNLDAPDVIIEKQIQMLEERVQSIKFKQEAKRNQN